MPARRRPARAIAITATEESRSRLIAMGINCAIAAILIAGLAIVAL